MNWMKRISHKKYSSEVTDPKKVTLPDKKFNKNELLAAIRQSIIAEQDAIVLYESFANSTTDDNAKKIFKDIADEEKIHVGEFQALLEHFEKNTEKNFIEKGKNEAIEKMGE